MLHSKKETVWNIKKKKAAHNVSKDLKQQKAIIQVVRDVRNNID